VRARLVKPPRRLRDAGFYGVRTLTGATRECRRPACRDFPYLGSLLLRVAAFWCFVGAGLLLLVAGQAEVRHRRPARPDRDARLRRPAHRRGHGAQVAGHLPRQRPDSVGDSKTEAGVPLVDILPALGD
jgi:hypothetical protein